MNKIVISGYSDDIVSVQGDTSEEFYVYDEPCVLRVEPFGEIVTVEYTLDGIWKVIGPYRDEFEYFDVGEYESARDYSEAVVVTCEDAESDRRSDEAHQTQASGDEISVVRIE